MKDNFDLKKFLTENKLTSNSKLSKVNELKDVEDGRDIGGKIIEFADGKNVDINVDYQRGKTKDFKDIPVEKAIDIVNQYIDQNDLTQASTDETGLILQVDDGDTAIDITKAGMSEKAPGYMHDCAAKVMHEKYGNGDCIPEEHTLVKEGNKYVVTHYDVLFESGKTVKNIPVGELKIITESHHGHKRRKK